MSTFEQINLGSDNAGTGGDSYRGASDKTNRNFTALARLLPGPMGYVTDNTQLALADVGKRVTLMVEATGKTVWLPLAGQAGSDATILLWNLRSAVTVSGAGADQVDIGQLQTGDWAVYVADGDKIWHVVQRGRNGWNEVVSGDLNVRGAALLDGEVRVAQAAAEGRIRVGAVNGYFYAQQDSVGYWAGDAGSFQFVFADKSFRVSGHTVYHDGNFNPAGKLDKSTIKRIGVGYAESDAIVNTGGDSTKRTQIFGFSYTQPAGGAGAMMLTALVRPAWLSGAVPVIDMSLRLIDTTSGGQVTGLDWSQQFSAAEMGSFWAHALSIPIAADGLAPGRVYEIRLYAGKNSDGRCQLAILGSGLAF
ncbi:hypothetical protein AB4851_20800 [Burkholderia sp. 22PA0099]|uniref:hypothetical protein n=1 Tax=Burkholderia sp. 22PA0099 TaxID=3237372 RepID=UPI0039C4929A